MKSSFFYNDENVYIDSSVDEIRQIILDKYDYYFYGQNVNDEVFKFFSEMSKDDQLELAKKMNLSFG